MVFRMCASLPGLVLAIISSSAFAGAEVAATSAAPVAVAAATHAQNGDHVSLGGDHQRTRFVIGLDKAVQFQVFSLSNPNRVIVELPNVGLQLPHVPEGQAVGLVQSFRGGVSAPGRSRIVIDVTKPVVVESARIEKGKDGKAPRLAVDIVPVQAAVSGRKALKAQPYGLGAAAVQPPLPKGVGDVVMKAFGLPPSRVIGDIKRALEKAIESGELEPHLPSEDYVAVVAKDPARFGLDAAATRRDAPD